MFLIIWGPHFVWRGFAQMIKSTSEVNLDRVFDGQECQKCIFRDWKNTFKSSRDTENWISKSTTGHGSIGFSLVNLFGCLLLFKYVADLKML